MISKHSVCGLEDTSGFDSLLCCRGGGAQWLALINLYRRRSGLVGVVISIGWVAPNLQLILWE